MNKGYESKMGYGPPPTAPPSYSMATGGVPPASPYVSAQGIYYRIIQI
jgi:hypothetical protein